VGLCQVANGGQIGDVAVHTEDAIGDDQPEAGVTGLAQLCLKVVHVTVAIAEALRLAEADAVDDGGVVQLSKRPPFASQQLV
jgi:hypothetical protein